MSNSKKAGTKKILSVLLAVALFVGCLPAVALPASAIGDITTTEGLSYDYVTFTYRYEKPVAVTSAEGATTGATEMQEQEETMELFAVTGYTGESKEVVVPASVGGIPVEYVAEYAFAGSDITYVKLPDTVRGIDEGAFFDCKYLTTVIIGANPQVNKFADFTNDPFSRQMLNCAVGNIAFSNCPLLRHFAVYTSKFSGTLSSTFGVNVFSGDSNVTFYGWGASNIIRDYQVSLGNPTMDYKDLSTIEAAVLGIEIAPVGVFMSVGESFPLTISVIPESSAAFLDKYSFTSDNYDVVGVSDDGVLTAVGNGVATIKVSTITGHSAQCEVTVAERVYGDYIYRFSSAGKVSIVKFNNAVSGEVTIPDAINGYPVTGIDSYAFRDCVKVTSVTIPDTIEVIGTGAFYGCTYLSTLNIASSSNLKIIGNSAFYGCTSLAFVKFDFALESIGAAAFRDCTSLAAVIIPDSVVTIGDQAFYGTTSLSVFAVKGTNLAVGNTKDYFGIDTNVTIFGEAAFTALSGYAAARFIPYVAYTGATIADSVSFNDNCKTNLVLGEKSQYSATAVNSSPEYIIAYVSDDATVVKVDINGVATALAEGTARIYAILCDGTTDILSVDVAYGESGDFRYKLLENNTKAEIVNYTNATETEIAVPDTVSFDGADIPVVSVGTGAFSNAFRLKKISIGAGVVSLSGASFDCAYALEEIEVNPANSYFTSLNGVLYNKQRTALLKFPAAKQGETNTASFTVPSNVASIGDYAFKDNINLVQINLSDKITKIGAHSFESTERLMNLELPYPVANIGDFAFAYNSLLKYVLIRQAASEISDTAFVGTESAVIYGYPGYAAEGYAEDHEMSFINANLLVRISELRLNDSWIVLNKTYSYTITPEVFPSSAVIKDYYYKSLNESVATVSADGVVTAVDEGEADVVVYSSNGVYSICHVSVIVDFAEPITLGCTGLRIVITPDNTVYESGKEPDLKGMIVYADYNDGTSKKIIYDDETTGESVIIAGVRLRGYNPAVAGSQTVTIIYGEQSIDFPVSYLEPYVTGVSVSSLPNKAVYVTGQSLETAGLTLAVSYSNGTVKQVSTGYTTTAISAKLGVQSVIVSYEGFECSFDVTVKAREVASINVTPPTKTEVLEGSVLDFTGLLIEATYDNETTGELSLNDVVLSGYDTSVVGPQVVTVTYITVDSVEITDTFSITVIAKTLVGIKVIAQPDKDEYILGEKLDITGMIVVAVYDNDSYIILEPEHMYDFDNVVLSLKENKFDIAYENFQASFTVYVRMGNYNNEFEYQIINGDEIEIVKKLSSTSVGGDYVIPTQINGMDVTSIQKNAFKDCDLLTAVTIPDTVTTIGPSAFEGCDKLQKATIGNSVSRIPDKCFYGCPKLDKVTIPESVDSIGDLAFARCTALKNISIPSSVYAISDNALNYSPNATIAAPANSYAYEYGQGMANKPVVMLKAVPDVTGDGFATTSDARMLLRAAARLETLNEQQKINGDIDGDGVITTSDARAVLRIAAQLDSYTVA